MDVSRNCGAGRNSESSAMVICSAKYSVWKIPIRSAFESITWSYLTTVRNINFLQGTLAVWHLQPSTTLLYSRKPTSWNTGTFVAVQSCTIHMTIIIVIVIIGGADRQLWSTQNSTMELLCRCQTFQVSHPRNLVQEICLCVTSSRKFSLVWESWMIFCMRNLESHDWNAASLLVRHPCCFCLQYFVVGNFSVRFFVQETWTVWHKPY